MKAETIHIAFCVNDGYVPFTTVTIKSIAENNRGNDVVVHLFSDRISASSRQRLAEAVSGYERLSLEVHLVDDLELKGLNAGKWTVYAWYRILLPEILPAEVKKVLYLDADTLVVTDLRELFDLDLTGCSVAGALDTLTFYDETFERCGYERALKYICSGVLLINLDYWREKQITRQLIAWEKENHDRIAFADQDAINYVCRETKIVLPLRYNVFKVYLTSNLYTSAELSEEVKACACRPAIIHYANYYPWIKACATHPMQGEWEKYNRMLRHPVRSHYVPRRWRFQKIVLYRIWDLLRAFGKRPERMKPEDIKRRFSETGS